MNGEFDIFDIHNFDDVETIDEQISIVKNILKQYGFEKRISG